MKCMKDTQRKHEQPLSQHGVPPRRRFFQTFPRVALIGAKLLATAGCSTSPESKNSALEAKLERTIRGTVRPMATRIATFARQYPRAGSEVPVPQIFNANLSDYTSLLGSGDTLVQAVQTKLLAALQQELSGYGWYTNGEVLVTNAILQKEHWENMRPGAEAWVFTVTARREYDAPEKRKEAA